jgi:hypothetical protein
MALRLASSPMESVDQFSVTELKVWMWPQVPPRNHQMRSYHTWRLRIARGWNSATTPGRTKAGENTTEPARAA